MALTVIEGVITSSIRYSSRRDGRARVNKIIAGIIVQIVSIVLFSLKVFIVSLFERREASMKVTKVIIITKITIAWS